MMLNFFKKRKSNYKDDSSLVFKESDKEKAIVDVTIVLNVWKRNYLDEQLKRLLKQSVLPREIWVIHYEEHVQTRKVIQKHKEKFPYIYLIKSDLNLKYFGRFSIAINITSTYSWLIDDDVMPGEQWLERSVEKCHANNAIVVCTGRLIPKNDFRPERQIIGKKYLHFIGDTNNGEEMNYCKKDTIVDYGCNSYFFKTDWLRGVWATWPATFLSGEDIHLSATCKVNLNVNTMVLEQLDEKTSGNIKRSYGWDDHASWKKKGFINIREDIFRYHILERKWKPILWEL